MSDKNFKVKSGLQVPSLTIAGPVSTDASGNVTSNAALPVNQGGTGQTTAGNALNALLPLQTGQDNKFFQTNGVSTQWTTPQQQTSTDGTLGYKVYSGTVTPSSPVTGDIWIDQTTGNGIQLVRWRKTIASTTTTLTGLDDNNLTLSYTPGNEQVYINGTLITRGQDYTATNGTSVVLTQAAETGDTVEIFGNPLFSVTDVYTQAQSNSLYVNNSNYSAAGKNKIINGDFGIWQRGTSFSGGSGYKADRMFSDVGPSNLISRSTDVPLGQGFVYSYKFTNVEVNCPIRHAIELPATGALGVYQVGTTWTFSMWAKSSAARTINLYAAFTIGNNGTPEATPVNAVGIGTTSATWQRFSYTFNIPAGTSLTSATCFQITPFTTGNGTGVDVFFAGMQLEQGSVATSFSTNASSLQAELAACQRYYVRWDTVNEQVGFYWGNGTSYNRWNWTFPVVMRTSPTISKTGNIAAFNPSFTGQAISTIGGNYSSTRSASVDGNLAGTVGSNGQTYLAYILNSSQYVEASAEL